MDVSDWRDRIDEIDRGILTLLSERAQCVLELAPLKRQKAIPIEEPEREATIRSNLRQHNHGPLSHEAVCRIFEAIMGEMKAVQQADVRQENRRAVRGTSASRTASKGSSRANNVK